MGLRKGILARVSVPCVFPIISFNRTFGSYYIIEGGLRKGTASSRSVQSPLSGKCLECVINIHYQ